MQTIAINNEAYADATEATVFGPFFVEDSPDDRARRRHRGRRARRAVLGRGHGHRHRRHPGRRRADRGVGGRRGRLLRRAVRRRPDRRPRPPLQPTTDGRYRFWAVTPTPYPIPHDGPVGEMLEATGRSPMRASHLHFMVRRTAAAPWSPTSSCVATSCSTPTASSGSRTRWSSTSSSSPDDADPRRTRGRRHLVADRLRHRARARSLIGQRPARPSPTMRVISQHSGNLGASARRAPPRTVRTS